MFSFIIEHAKWVFSGIGLLALPLLWSFMKRILVAKKRPQPRAIGLEISPALFAPQAPEPEPAPIWKFVEHLPFCQTWARRKIYTPARIAGNIRAKINGDEHGIRFYWAEEAPTVSISLYIVNLNPFPITVDRIVGDFSVSNAAVAPFSYMRRGKVAQCSDSVLYFEIPLSEKQVRRAHQLRDHGRIAGVNATLTILTPFEQVELSLHLKTGNTEFVNFHLLQTK